MATATVTLSGVAPAAERALFAFPTWTTKDTGTAAALTATTSAVAGYQHCLTHITVSFSAAPSGALQLLIKDGTTTIWQTELGTEVRIYTENFETRPLHASVNADLTATVASAGGSVVQTIQMAGFSVKGA